MMKDNVKKIENRIQVKIMEKIRNFSITTKAFSIFTGVVVGFNVANYSVKPVRAYAENTNATKLEMPFEWEITLENGLWWKIEKQMHNHDFEIPKYLKINPEDILLLEE